MAGTKTSGKGGSTSTAGSKGKTVTTSKNIGKVTTTYTAPKNTGSSNAKAGGGSTVGTNVSTPAKVTVTTNTKNNSTPTNTKTNTSTNYVSKVNNGNGTTTYKKANGDSWTENGKGQVISKVVNGGGMSVAPTPTNSSSSSKNTKGSNTGGSSSSSSSGYVSKTNNGNGTTTYVKANGDKWTEDSKGQVISKEVNGGGMSVAPTSNNTTTSKTNNVSKGGASLITPVVGNNVLANFANNTGAYKTQNVNGSPAVQQLANGGVRYADGSEYNPATGLTTKDGKVVTKAATNNNTNSSQKTTIVKTNTGNTTASNGYKEWNYMQVNERGSKAVQQAQDGTIRYADGSTYNPNTGKTTGATKSTVTANQNKTQVANTSNISTPKSSFDYTKQNANGSPAVANMADGSIRYADGSIYNPKTGQTTDTKGNVIVDKSQGTQVTEDIARAEANKRTNNTNASNSTNYNNISTTNNRVNNNTQNQSALSTVLKSQSNSPLNPTVKTDSLDVGGTNRNKGESQETASKNEDGSINYIAPNGKQYTITKDVDGNYIFDSKGGETKGNWVYYTPDGENINNSLPEILKFLHSENQVDGINRTNVDNRDAVRGAKIEGTYIAPSGKEYDILEGTGNNEGKVGFVNFKGEAQWFDSQDAALDYIDARNPVGSTDTGKNKVREELIDRGYVDENGNPITGIESIDEANEGIENDKEEEIQTFEDLKEYMDEYLEDWRDSMDEVDRNKYNILNQSLLDFDNFNQKLDDAVNDLAEKSKLLQDNERMRWARQRAAELAAKGYLTSEQVAQVANYSLTDYNKELEANALEAAKAIAELRLNIAQKANDALAAIRTQQFNNENDRLNQINFINEWRTKMEDAITAKMSSVNQFYNGLVDSNLKMNIQNDLGYDSIIRQNDAQNIVDDRNLQLALTDSAYRRKYILNQISDVNLHAYAEKIMNYLQSQGKFLIRSGSNEQMRTDLAKQISAIVDAARQQQLIDQQNLAKL